MFQVPASRTFQLLAEAGVREKSRCQRDAGDSYLFASYILQRTAATDAHSRSKETAGKEQTSVLECECSGVNFRIPGIL